MSMFFVVIETCIKKTYFQIKFELEKKEYVLLGFLMCLSCNESVASKVVTSELNWICPKEALFLRQTVY